MLSLARQASAVYSKTFPRHLLWPLSSCTLHCQRSTSSTMSDDKFALAKKYQGFEKNIWVEFVQLALEYKPLNLGQGFPDFAAPDYVLKALGDTVTSSNVLLQQYTRGFGHPRLINILSKFYSKIVNKDINPQTELLVTDGAYEALFCSVMGNVNPGDEVIIIEPYFDCYEPMVKLAGGIPVFVPLYPTKTGQTITSGDWKFNSKELSEAFNKKTKAIIINTPNNPLGKIFTKEELEEIADLCKKWNAMVISDEVYEWLVYKGYQHVRIASLPGMWERTVTIGSAGKTFSVTGWKLGWAYGPAHLIKNLQTVHQHCVYTCPTPIQEAVACGFELEIGRLSSPECYFKELPRELEAKRDYMAKFLAEVGMCPTIPEGGYFMMADWTPIADKADLKNETDKHKDYKFVKWLSKTKKLQGIPPSAFYCSEHKHIGENYIRFCFIKEDANLQKADQILKDWKQSF